MAALPYLAPVAALLLSACGGGSEPVAEPEASDLAQAQLEPPKSWGEALLRLVPDRIAGPDPEPPRIVEALPFCSWADSRSGGLEADCAGPPGQEENSIAVRAEYPDGSGAPLLRLTACCGSERGFFDPLQGASLIRTELFCPDQSLRASESATAYRIAAPGKQDVAYLHLSRPESRGRVATFIFHFGSLEGVEPCGALAEAQGAFSPD